MKKATTSISISRVGKVFLTLAVVSSLFVVLAIRVSAQPTCDAHFTSSPMPQAFRLMFTPVQGAAGTTYRWDFGDGTIDSSNTMLPLHTYPSAGTYYVCLSISRSFFGTCSDNWCDSVHVLVQPPPSNCNAYFNSMPDTALNTIDFQSFPNSGTATYAWTFGDGNTSSAASPTHTYASPGKYYVCLTVADTANGGCTHTQCDSVAVNLPPPPPACNAHFTYNALYPSNNILFISSSNSGTAHYSWNFGDGNTSNQPSSATHLYASAGTYYACLTVTDTTSSGTCTDTQCDSVHVTMPPPPACSAHFVANNLPNNKVLLISPFNMAGTTYAWDFGDGNTSTAKNINHAYASAGVYYVCLTVADSTSSGKCTDTFCDSVHVQNIGPPPPTCTATFSSNPMPAAHSLMFHPAQGPAGTAYHWDFGDGDSSAQFIPVHQYASSGTYTVCLTVTRHFFGTCTDTWCNAVSARMAGNAGAVQDANIAIYPNPFSEKAILHLENTTGNVTFRMNDITGRLVMIRSNLSNGDFELNKNDIVAGMYFYQIYDGNNLLSTGKLIIQ